jgi:hypothetical protein
VTAGPAVGRVNRGIDATVATKRGPRSTFDHAASADTDAPHTAGVAAQAAVVRVVGDVDAMVGAAIALRTWARCLASPRDAPLPPAADMSARSAVARIPLERDAVALAVGCPTRAAAARGGIASARPPAKPAEVAPDRMSHAHLAVGANRAVAAHPIGGVALDGPPSLPKGVQEHHAADGPADAKYRLATSHAVARDRARKVVQSAGILAAHAMRHFCAPLPDPIGNLAANVTLHPATSQPRHSQQTDRPEPEKEERP